MSVLWAGGEDVDFPTLASATVVTTAGRFRSGYARCAIQPGVTTAPVKSNVFVGGAITDGWLSAVCFNNSMSSSRLIVGFGKIGTDAGLFVGTHSSTSSRLSLWKTTGAVDTLLASEVGSSFAAQVLHRIDMHVTSHGASATVDVYLNGALVITYSGDTTVAGFTDMDAVFLRATNSNVSEVVVADEDTRTFSVVTLAPTNVGDTNAWTGSHLDVDETTANDADVLTTDTVAQDCQLQLSDLPSGSFSVRAVKVTARASKTVSATAGSVALGVKSGGTVDAGSNQALTTSWATYERLMTQNPVTTAAWTRDEANALQLNLRSAA